MSIWRRIHGQKQSGSSFLLRTKRAPTFRATGCRTKKSPMPSWSSNSGRLVKVVYARHELEPKTTQGLLGPHALPTMVQRSVDNPELLAAGPRQILVPGAAV